MERTNVMLDQNSLKILRQRRRERGEGYSKSIRLAISLLKSAEKKEMRK